MRVPVLYVASGGFGEAGLDTLDLLGSTDVTTLSLRPNPGWPATRDFGHVDTFLAGNADTLVWRPVLDWVVSHSGRGRKACDGSPATGH